MDYEKLHKNTLAALQQRVSEGKITEEIARSICADFVKESEDEKIRNWLIDYFNKINDEIELLDRKKIVSWLEKQGEYANFRNKIQIGDEVTRNEDGALVNLSQFKRMVKQGNHKPIKWNSDDLLKRNQIMDILQEYNRPELIAWLEKQGEPRVDMIQ